MLSPGWSGLLGQEWLERHQLEAIVVSQERDDYDLWPRDVELRRVKNGWKWSESVSRSVVSNSVTPWTIASQAPVSMELSRQEYWSVCKAIILPLKNKWLKLKKWNTIKILEKKKRILWKYPFGEGRYFLLQKMGQDIIRRQNNQDIVCLKWRRWGRKGAEGFLLLCHEEDLGVIQQNRED